MKRYETTPPSRKSLSPLLDWLWRRSATRVTSQTQYRENGAGHIAAGYGVVGSFQSVEIVADLQAGLYLRRLWIN